MAQVQTFIRSIILSFGWCTDFHAMVIFASVDSLAWLLSYLTWFVFWGLCFPNDQLYTKCHTVGNFTKFPVMEISLKGTVSAEFRAIRIQIKWLVSMSNVTLGWNGLNEKWKKKKKQEPDSLIVVRLRRNLLRTLYRRCFDIMFPQNEKMEITSMGFIVGVFLVDLVINIYSNKWFSAGICLLEVSNSNSRSRCKICSK